MRFLLDTNIVSEPLRRVPNAKVVRQLALHEGHYSIAAVTWHELRFGAERLPDGKRKEALHEALEVLRAAAPIVEYDAAAAEWHARQRARLLSKGWTEQTLDGQIAALAATRRLTLVTANMKHFEPYGDVELVDWSR